MDSGDFITVHLLEPKRQFWGKVLNLFEAGVVIRGLDVQFLDRFKYQLGKQDRTVFLQTIFFPMRRIEQLSLDEAVGSVPSVITNLRDYSGLSDQEILT